MTVQEKINLIRRRADLECEIARLESALGEIELPETYEHFSSCYLTHQSIEHTLAELHGGLADVEQQLADAS